MPDWRNIFSLYKTVYEFIKSRFALHSIYIAFSFVVGTISVDSIGFNTLSPVINTLQNMSAAVFTLAGIWIAYSYPEAISAYTSPDTVTLIPTDKTRRIENLVLIVLTSAFVIISLLVFNLLSVFLSSAITNPDLRIYLKSSGLSFVVYMSLIQAKAVIVIMTTNIAFINELHGKKVELEANNDL